jgi:hypothetical protein
MKKPYVEWLRYRLEIDGGNDYSSVEPLKHVTDRFILTLDDHMLNAKPTVRYRTVAKAREALEPVLRVYEINSSLQRDSEEFRFQFKDFNLCGAPPNEEEAEKGVGPWASTNARTRARRETYPAFPEHFELTPEVETLWTRWRSYHQGREKLLPMAYFCLTVLEYRAELQYAEGKKRANAADLFTIDKDILDKIGELSTTRGDRSSARKVVRELKELAADEKQWLLVCIPKLIEHVAHPDPDRLNMDDLPSLL